MEKSQLPGYHDYGKQKSTANIWKGLLTGFLGGGGAVLNQNKDRSYVSFNHGGRKQEQCNSLSPTVGAVHSGYMRGKKLLLKIAWE